MNVGSRRSHASGRAAAETLIDNTCDSDSSPSVRRSPDLQQDQDQSAWELLTINTWEETHTTASSPSFCVCFHVFFTARPDHPSAAAAFSHMLKAPTSAGWSSFPRLQLLLWSARLRFCPCWLVVAATIEPAAPSTPPPRGAQPRRLLEREIRE